MLVFRRELRARVMDTDYVKWAMPFAAVTFAFNMTINAALCLLIMLNLLSDKHVWNEHERKTVTDMSIAAFASSFVTVFLSMWIGIMNNKWAAYIAHQNGKDKKIRYKKWLEQVDVEYHLRTALSELKHEEGAVDSVVVREHFDEAQQIAKMHDVELMRDAEGGVYARLQT